MIINTLYQHRSNNAALMVTKRVNYIFHIEVPGADGTVTPADDKRLSFREGDWFGW